MKTMIPRAASALAPASIGNIGVGFDVLGQAFGAAWDEVVAVPVAERGVWLDQVSGLTDRLPDGVHSNSALASAKAVLDAAGARFGVRLSIHKGIPLSAGMGGSAASAVAGAAAVNALLPHPFDLAALLPFAIEGERVSSDPPPWDNVAAALFGGVTLVACENASLVSRLPVPAGVTAVLLQPECHIATREARDLLRPQVPMQLAVEHSRRIAAFVAGCATNDLGLVRVGLEDLLVESQRAHLLPCFAPVKAAALAAGAIGCSFSGSGPSVFAWALEREADKVSAAMAGAFAAAGIKANAYQAPLDSPGVHAKLLPDLAAAGGRR